jgi:hypothetical protein
MSIYQYPVKRSYVDRSRKQPVASVPLESVKLSRLIQGLMPDSKEEVLVADALDTLKVRYIYQYSVFGGRNIRLGQVVDFLCKVVPASVALQVMGEHWHQGELKGYDKLGLLALQKYFGRENVLVLWAGDLVDAVTTLAAVRKGLRL